MISLPKTTFYMVKTIVVRGPTLARLAVILVRQRAVNRQSRSCAGDSHNRSASLNFF